MPYFLIVLLFFPFHLVAKDYGRYGAIFEIQEEDLMMVLKNRLEAMKMDEKTEDGWQRIFVSSIESPKGKDFPKTKTPHKFEYDPTILLRDEIRDHEGNLIVPKGTAFNPLDTHHLHEPLLFVDGSDNEQMEWVKKQSGIVVLTKGKPLNLENLLNRPIYFDQAAYLTNKLGIKALPARVTQNGSKLLVEELLCI